MAGSKKGERRGGAKPGHIRKTVVPAAKKPKSPKSKGGRPFGSKNKPKYDPALVALLNKRGHGGIERREREIEMYRVITGKSVRLPKEVMLDAMRYFENSAVEYSQVLQANLEAAAEAKTPEERIMLGEAVSQAEGQVDKYVAMAADVAFKAAPYLHPRLAAIITNPGGDKSSMTMLQMLMQDLDEAGKPARFIEHDPDEGNGRT
jgi:hypothetical protein